ncbi:hypothetical protein HPB49_007471 [Dermacentor silvarum]|uniref:Uncharacterized protein n=1 Tax=Dermacentor silvarum TaxID=543639 RepID=A0ACB8DIP5_DERSI|nr:hypothetical protein HPB49_007471 [Dermacentor silvarum]
MHSAQSSGRRSKRLQSVAGPTSGRLRRNDAFSSTSRESIGADRTRKGSVRSRDGHSSQQNLEQRADVLEVVMNNLVVFFVLLSLVLGFAVGAVLNPLHLSELQRSMMRLPGELFVRVLQCLVIPLFITSVVSAVGGQPTAEGARLALRTLAYFSLITLWSATSGMVITLLLRPGVGARKLPPHRLYNATMRADSLLDIFRHERNSGELRGSIRLHDVGDEAHLEKLAHTNFVGLLGFSLLLGFALSQLLPPPLCSAMTDLGGVFAVGVETPPAGSSHFLLRLARVLSSKFQRMTEKTLWLSPVAVSTLIAVDASRVSDLSTVMWHLGQYSFTVLLGLGVHAFLFLPALYMTKVLIHKPRSGFALTLSFTERWRAYRRKNTSVNADKDTETAKHILPTMSHTRHQTKHQTPAFGRSHHSRYQKQIYQSMRCHQLQRVDFPTA